MNKQWKRIIVFALLCVLTLGLTTTAMAAAKPKLATKTATVAIGYTKTLKVSNTAGLTVTWKSSDTSIATVSEKGEVKGVSTGEVLITCKAGSTKLKATVTVVDKAALKSNNASVKVGGTVKLKATYVAGRTLTWKSSNTSVATVSSTGKVTGVKAGTATIRCKVDGGKTLKATVKVVDKAKLSSTAFTLNLGDAEKLTKTLKVKNAAGRALTWTSSNTKVATVAGGKVTAVAEGTATIKCKVANGPTLKATVKVTDPAVLSPTSARILKGETETFTVKNLGGRTVTWSSEDTSIATVSSTGVVTGKDCGPVTKSGKSTYIIAELSGGKKLKAKVTVYPAVTMKETNLVYDETSGGKKLSFTIRNNTPDRTIKFVQYKLQPMEGSTKLDAQPAKYNTALAAGKTVTWYADKLDAQTSLVDFVVVLVQFSDGTTWKP